MSHLSFSSAGIVQHRLSRAWEALLLLGAFMMAVWGVGLQVPPHGGCPMVSCTSSCLGVTLVSCLPRRKSLTGDCRDSLSFFYISVSSMPRHSFAAFFFYIFFSSLLPCLRFPAMFFFSFFGFIYPDAFFIPLTFSAWPYSFFFLT